MNRLRNVLMVVCLLSAVTGLMAQMRAPTSPSDSVVFRGFSAHLDIASPLMGIAVDKGVITGEIQFDVNLRNKFFPIVEVGYAAIEHVADNGATYRAGAPFWRLGLNYNVLKTKREDGSEKLNRHYPFVGLRYGMSVVNYELSSVPLARDYWGETDALAWHGRHAYAGWLELLAGVRVDLVNGFTMGWSVRINLLLHSSLDNKELLWYVPGYGRSSGTQFTFNYTIGFNYRTKYERARMERVQ